MTLMNENAMSGGVPLSLLFFSFLFKCSILRDIVDTSMLAAYIRINISLVRFLR